MTGGERAGTNWAGNVTYSAPVVHRPTSVEQLQELVAGSRRIRALGTRHSFSTVADGPGLVSLADLPKRLEVDPRAATVTVSAGLRWGDVGPALHQQGYALRNLGSLPHICVAGAVATGTHGSGDGNGNLATSVRAFEMVTATGELVAVDREVDEERFLGSLVALGSLGLVTQLTLDVVPTYDVRQDVFEDLPWEPALEHLDEVMAGGYSVSLFTTWRPDVVDQVWLKRVVNPGDPVPSSEPTWRGATAATEPRHPLPGLPGTSCTQQLGRPGPWHERLPHFRLDLTPSSGEELQSEYFVDRSVSAAALEAVLALSGVIAPVLQVSEIRTVAADELWLSPAYRRDCLAIHFTWVQDQPAVTPVLKAVEEALAPFSHRPHWGKVFVTSPEAIADSYERFADMQALVGHHDPDGKFRNTFLDTYLPST